MVETIGFLPLLLLCMLNPSLILLLPPYFCTTCRITAKLRYYPKDYVREFMAESVSFLLRKALTQQLKKGTAFPCH